MDMEFLNEHPIFKGIDKEMFISLAEDKVIVLNEGGWLFEQGEKSDGMYVILSGEIEVLIKDDLGKQNQFTILSEGGVLGEIGLLTGHARSASAKATVPSELIFIKADIFQGQLDAGSLVAHKMVYNLSLILANKLEETNEHLLEVKKVIKNTGKEIADFRKKLMSDYTL